MSQLTGIDRCAPAAELRGDDLSGTAAPVNRWLLIEQPGGWGRNALHESQIPQAIARQLAAAATGAGLRIVLIRRPGRGETTDRRAWACVDSRPGHEGVRWGSYLDHRELLDVMDGSSGEPSVDPVYLVCAHGRHDACCAMRGRPLCGELDRMRAGQAWECSHIGGDRFAANVVVLPEGLYYGRVSVDAAADVVAAYDARRVVLPLLRGRSSLPAPVQAAQYYTRLRLDRLEIDALPPRQMEQITADMWRVVLTDGTAEITVCVRAERAAPVRLTCSSDRDESVRVFRLVGWE